MRSILRQTVWDRTHGRCFYCGVHLTPDDKIPPGWRGGFQGGVREMHIDHMVPPTRGGSVDAPENLAPACHQCNVSKGQMSPDEFRTWLMVNACRPPVPFHGEPKTVERDWLCIASPIRRRDRSWIDAYR